MERYEGGERMSSGNFFRTEKLTNYLTIWQVDSIIDVP